MDETCTWTEDEDGVWDTACGNRFEIMNGTPTENELAFCPYCGKGLECSAWVDEQRGS